MSVDQLPMPQDSGPQTAMALPVKDLPPSHKDFDRSQFTDAEFIEMLLFENKELQSTIKVHEETIRRLQSPEDKHGVPKSKPVDIVVEQSARPATGSMDDVPQRSARRRNDRLGTTHETGSRLSLASATSKERRASNYSITSNGPIDANEGMPLSPGFRSELSAAALSHSPDDKVGLILVGVTLDPSKGGNSEPERRPDASYFDQERRLLAQSSTPPNGSFKSRIRHPQSLQQASRQFDNTVIGQATNGNQDTDMITDRPQEQEIEPVTFAEPQDVLSSPYLPRTPDGFSSNKFASKGVPTLDFSDMASSTPTSLTTPLYKNNTKYSQQSLVSPSSFERPSSQTPGSSFHVLHTPKPEEDDVTLFIKPEDFQTIRIKVVSTITVNAKKSDEHNCTFSINDKASDKEMWRIRKSYNQIVAFDNEIRPVIEFFGLPPIPDKAIFGSTTPLKVDSRMRSLQDYFNTIFTMPHIPQTVLYRICRYISLDFVNPLDDFKSGAKKEGFLIRRYKGLGTTWKVRWCLVDGPALEIYDQPAGNLIEQIKLSGSQIGRQSADIVAEERGYRHAFLILESSKSSKISGAYPKHFFCAESDTERDEWIAAMVEFTENDPLAGNEHDDSSKTSTPQDENAEFGLRASKYVSGTSSNTLALTMEEANNLPAFDEANHKDGKKLKMRSLFPFRSKPAQVEEASPSEPSLSPLINQQPPNTSMNSYLDQMKLSDDLTKSVFGRELEFAFNLSHKSFNGYEIPSICYRCLDFLNRTGAIYEEGIFRLSGSASTIRQLKDKFNSAFDVDLFTSPLKPDIHTISGLLKTYLRELPHPIFGAGTYGELQRIITENSSRVPESSISLMIRDYLRDPHNIARVNLDLCVVIFGFLKAVIAQSSSNRMSLKNVCIVFVPTLNVSVEVLSLCLVDFDCVFRNGTPTPDHLRESLDLQIPTF